MPTYAIKDNVTGRTIKITRDTPPSEEEAAELFNVPEIVSGNKQEMANQRARNLQRELGLSDPVAPVGGVNPLMRMKAGFAPTQEEQKAAYEAEYGKGNFIPISSKRGLVRIPDGKGGFQWRIDNPKGLDFGDIAESTSMLPEMIAGGTAAASVYPGVQGTFAKAAAASGASALVANVVGAIQDSIYRKAVGTDVQPSEILKRRGLGAGLEFFTGMVLPYGADKIADAMGRGKAARNFIKSFISEGEEAKKALKKIGVAANTTSELGDAIRMSQPANITASEAGEKIANALSDFDSMIRQSSEKLAGMAVGSAEKRAMAQMPAPIRLTERETGLAAIGAAKKTLQDANDRVSAIYDSAYKQIADDVATGGSDKYFISLNATDDALKTLRSKMLRKDTGEPSDFYAPLLNQIKQIEETVGVEQKLEAVRNVRSMLGERIKGKGGIFGDMNEGVAKQLYATLSKDIDDSVARFSGTGGQLLRTANDEYKRLVQPVEASRFLDNLVNDGFQQPEEVIATLVRGGTSDWLAAKSVLTPNVYDYVRRSVVDKLMGGSKISVAGREVADIGTLNRSLSQIQPEVKNEIFGNRAAWESLEKIGKELDFIKAREGLFTAQSLPSMDKIREAQEIAKNEGVDKANAYIKSAINAASQRRSNLAASLRNQIVNGNTKHVAENPEAFFDAFALSGQYGPDYVYAVMNKLPGDVKEQVSRVGFQRLFERARDVSGSVISGKTSNYNLEAMMKQVLGSKKQQDSVEAVIGPERMDTLKNWMKVEMATQIKNAQRKSGGRSLAGLVAVAPYQNLFAARATSMALDKAAGRSFVAQASPDIIELFSDARLSSRFPNQTAAAMQVIQQAASHPLYGTYKDMMSGFTPEQQDAIDEYIKGSELDIPGYIPTTIATR